MTKAAIIFYVPIMRKIKKQTFIFFGTKSPSGNEACARNGRRIARVGDEGTPIAVSDKPVVGVGFANGND